MRKTLSIIAALLMLTSFASIGKAQNTLPFSFDFGDGMPSELTVVKVNPTSGVTNVAIAADPLDGTNQCLKFTCPNTNNYQRRVQLSQSVNLTYESGLYVSFDWLHQSTEMPRRQDGVQLQYSIDGGSNWVAVGNPVLRYMDPSRIPQDLELEEGQTDFWLHYSFGIPQVAGQSDVIVGLLFIRGGVSVSGTTYNYLDNLEIEVAEDDCFPPTNVRVYNVTGDAATVAWTDNSGASSWRIQYDGGLMVTADNPCTVYYLEPGTPYSLSVGVWCTSASAWSFSEEVEFETLPCASTHEVYYDFEDDISECVILKSH